LINDKKCKNYVKRMFYHSEGSTSNGGPVECVQDVNQSMEEV
jgi:hypothetical protein